MEKWIARESNGDLFLYDSEPQEVEYNADTTSGGWNPHYKFDYWKSDGGRIKLHPNTYKTVKPGQKHKCDIKIKLV